MESAGYQGGKGLIISEEGIDAKTYHNSYENRIWVDCTLRMWLNNDFYDAAFSAEENGKIVKTAVRTDKNPKYATDPGKNTDDYVFLLSVSPL